MSSRVEFADRLDVKVEPNLNTSLPDLESGIHSRELDGSQAPPLPLLISGVSGVAGHNAWEALRRRYGNQVWGLRQVGTFPPNQQGILYCDIEDLPGLKRLFERHRFAAVLDCGGNCALRACELDPNMAWRINHQGVANLVQAMRDFPSRLVRLSIDLVFAGRPLGEYGETEPTDPVTVYGKSMAAAEQLVLGSAPNACVARISLPMGPSPNRHAGAIDWIQSRFRKNKPATLYFDEVRTPTYTDCLNYVCCTLLRGEHRGLVHAGGPRSLSLFQIAQIVNRVGGYPPHLLHGCFRAEAGPIPPRAGNVSMSTRLLELTCPSPFVAWPFDPQLVPTHPEWHWDRDNRWDGGSFEGRPALVRSVLYHARYLGSPFHGALGS